MARKISLGGNDEGGSGENPVVASGKVFLLVKEGEFGLETFISDDFSMQLKYMLIFRTFLEGCLICVKDRIKELKKHGRS